MSDRLYWSRRGEVACDGHAPDPDSERWRVEGWQPVPDDRSRSTVRYQCQHCSDGPIRHAGLPDAGAPLILNVDDRPASLYLRDRILRQHGFSVANAGTGRSALDIARRLRPNLVLLDVHLPDIDGREVCQRLKSDAHTASIPVVLISATLAHRGESLTDLARASADGFIPEPVEPAELASAVRRVLNYPR